MKADASVLELRGGSMFPPRASETGGATMRLFHITLGVVAYLALLIFPASPEWKGERTDAAQAAWFAAQHNKQGDWCCDKSDGHWYEGDYTFNGDGSVTLKLAEGDHHIDAYKVLDNPNPTGRAVWWHNGAGKDYCFAPGTLG